MLFNNIYFIFIFLPIAVFLYYMISKIKPSYGKIVIILTGLFFYSFGRYQMLLPLLISIMINYCSVSVISKAVTKKRIMLIIPIILNIGMLFFFKYTNFLIENAAFFSGRKVDSLDIILPLGISFYTFQQISYVAAVYNQEIKSADLVNYLAYIMYFPKLIMGPIIDPEELIDQLNDDERKRFSIDNLAYGIQIFSFGLVKKALFASKFAEGVSWIYANLETASLTDSILLVLLYSLEIYFDFSGYSDMAVGVSMMFNIDLPINFDSPYKALSIREFWRRWHMSLTSFLTRYIYIPLGGSRKGKIRTYINIMIVFLVSGIWHGANWTYVIWGGVHGGLCCLDRKLENIENKVFVPVRWFITFSIVSMLWLLFGSESVGQWLDVLRKIAFTRSTEISDNLKYSIIFIVPALLICLIPENNYRNRNKLNVFSLLLSVVSFFIGVLYLSREAVFIYEGF